MLNKGRCRIYNLNSALERELVILEWNKPTDEYELMPSLERDENAVSRSRPIRLPQVQNDI